MSWPRAILPILGTRLCYIALRRPLPQHACFTTVTIISLALHCWFGPVPALATDIVLAVPASQLTRCAAVAPAVIQSAAFASQRHAHVLSLASFRRRHLIAIAMIIIVAPTAATAPPFSIVDDQFGSTTAASPLFLPAALLTGSDVGWPQTESYPALPAATPPRNCLFRPEPPDGLLLLLAAQLFVSILLSSWSLFQSFSGIPASLFWRLHRCVILHRSYRRAYRTVTLCMAQRPPAASASLSSKTVSVKIVATLVS